MNYLKSPKGDADANIYWYGNNWIRFVLVLFSGFGICQTV